MSVVKERGLDKSAMDKSAMDKSAMDKSAMDKNAISTSAVKQRTSDRVISDMRENYDFSAGKRGAVVKTTKERITIRLDPDVIQWFKDSVEGGGNYQSLMNEALRAHVQRQGEPWEDTLRRVIREEIHAGG